MKVTIAFMRLPADFWQKLWNIRLHQHRIIRKSQKMLFVETSPDHSEPAYGFIKFVKRGDLKDGKPAYVCVDMTTGEVIGSISYWESKKDYFFYPLPELIGYGQLQDLCSFMKQLGGGK